MKLFIKVCFALMIGFAVIFIKHRLKKGSLDERLRNAKNTEDSILAIKEWAYNIKDSTFGKKLIDSIYYPKLMESIDSNERKYIKECETYIIEQIKNGNITEQQSMELIDKWVNENVKTLPGLEDLKEKIKQEMKTNIKNTLSQGSD